MRNEFLQTPENYKPLTHTVTPYMLAKQEWDFRLGHTVVQAKNWRMAFFGVLCISLCLLGITGYQITQKRFVPVVITLDTQTGSPNVLGKTTEVSYVPQAQELKYFLSQFIQKVRAVPADPVLIKKSWLEAYAFLRREAATTLNAMANSEPSSPLKKIGDETVSIQPISITRVGETNSYQARWSEVVYAKNGSVKERYTMSGVFTIEIQPPSDEASIMTNPLGIYISTFQWAKEL